MMKFVQDSDSALTSLDPISALEHVTSADISGVLASFLSMLTRLCGGSMRLTWR